ncbi:MAG: hypothetical protein FWG74_06000 [Planctomycetes bacterium]|nr:hypothetical protein [Planctomycetota bacterium]
MPTPKNHALLLPLFLLYLICFATPAEKTAAAEPRGIILTPAKDAPGKIYTGDMAPSQVLEIIRSETTAVTVARLSTSCTCITASVEKKTFAPGERAFVEVRNVKATPAAGATYLVFVELESPAHELLTYDLFVKSGFPDSQTAPAPEPSAIFPLRPPPAR